MSALQNDTWQVVLTWTRVCSRWHSSRLELKTTLTLSKCFLYVNGTKGRSNIQTLIQVNFTNSLKKDWVWFCDVGSEEQMHTFQLINKTADHLTVSFSAEKHPIWGPEDLAQRSYLEGLGRRGGVQKEIWRRSKGLSLNYLRGSSKYTEWHGKG